MILIYQIIIRLYGIIIYLSCPFSLKARQWLDGRKNLEDYLPDGTKEKIIWFHCASLGEYEQAKPLIISLKNHYLEKQILVTFFSPSGFLDASPLKEVKFKAYMPLDTISNAKKFIQKVNPKCAIFIQSELWPNFLNNLQQRLIPTFIVSAKFKSNSHLFKFYGKWHLKVIKDINHFFVIDESSKILLNQHGINQVSISGDNRFDKVLENRLNKRDIPHIKSFTENKKVIVAGSTYIKDSEMLFRISQSMPEVKFIITPHNINEALKFKDFGLLYSQANETNVTKHQILIIDNVGILSQLYQYADVSYVGGAFGDGLHNILEAIVFGSKVIFGPNYKQYQEAIDAINEGIAKSVKSEKEMQNSINSFLSNISVNNNGFAFCNQRKGANDIILGVIKTIF